VCTLDLLMEERRVRWWPRWVWLLVILLGSLPGSLFYLLAGRDEG